MIRKRETQAFRDQQADAIDRNPSIECECCSESYKWGDYWIDRLMPRASGTAEVPFRCDECQERIDNFHDKMVNNHDIREWCR